MARNGANPATGRRGRGFSAVHQVVARRAAGEAGRVLSPAQRRFDSGLEPPNLRFRRLRLSAWCFHSASELPLRGPWKQKRPRRAAWTSLIFLMKSVAGEGIRTLDPNLGKTRSEASAPFGASCTHPLGAPDVLTPLTVSVGPSSA